MPDFQLSELGPEDRSSFRDYLRQRPYPSSAFAGPEELKSLALSGYEDTFDNLLNCEDLGGFLLRQKGQITGFILFVHRQTESITREQQTVILDFACPGASSFGVLLAPVKAAARCAGDSYLVCHTYESQTAEIEWAGDFGMHPELFRTYIWAEPNASYENHPDYLLRRALSHELLFIMNIVSGHSPAYIPAGRPVEREKIQQSFIEAYATLSVRDRKKVPLVLEKRATGELMGYAILQPGRVFGTGGPIGAYLYDIAIGAKGHGLGLSQWIVSGAKNLLSEMGGGFLYGDVSADNRLAVGANLSLGARIDSRRWGLKI